MKYPKLIMTRLVKVLTRFQSKNCKNKEENSSKDKCTKRVNQFLERNYIFRRKQNKEKRVVPNKPQMEKKLTKNIILRKPINKEANCSKFSPIASMYSTRSKRHQTDFSEVKPYDVEGRKTFKTCANYTKRAYNTRKKKPEYIFQQQLYNHYNVLEAQTNKTTPLTIDPEELLIRTPSKDSPYKSIMTKQMEYRNHKIIQRKAERRLSLYCKETTFSNEKFDNNNYKRNKTTSLNNSDLKQSNITQKEKYGITQQQRDKIKENMIDLKSYDHDELVKILMINKVNYFGSRLEIILRVVKGRVFGNSPNCPKCNERRLEQSQESGSFSCNCYKLTQAGILYCDASYYYNELLRETWKEKEFEEKEFEEKEFEEKEQDFSN